MRALVATVVVVLAAVACGGGAPARPAAVPEPAVPEPAAAPTWTVASALAVLDRTEELVGLLSEQLAVLQEDGASCADLADEVASWLDHHDADLRALGEQMRSFPDQLLDDAVPPEQAARLPEGWDPTFEAYVISANMGVYLEYAEGMLDVVEHCDPDAPKIAEAMARFDDLRSAHPLMVTP